MAADSAVGRGYTERSADPDAKFAVDALNESISRRMQAVAGACAASLIERGQLARSEERQRIARELHDRVGEALSVGLRRLDLQEVYGAGNDLSQADLARDVLVEAMRRLRAVTSGLREETWAAPAVLEDC